jgi:glyoxylase-like metal-dependent hydrolase (beta-lactamase superfamily II)
MTSSTHWTIKSAWSKAGVGTNIVLELKCAFDDNATANNTKTKKRPACVAFDMGATPCFDDAIPAKHVFLSHGHIDHVGALFSHARAHAVSCGG